MTQLLAALAPLTSGQPLRLRTLLAPLLALLVLGGGVALAVSAAVRPAPRTVTLLARGIAFYLPGDPTPNPRLTVARGERVRFVLRNEDAGIPHDLAVPRGEGRDGQGRKDRKVTPVVRGAGETVDLSYRAPQAAGEYEYVCTLHSRMMRGILEVR
jgi:Copper binding proteins, plastocyanin/azurin family